MKIEDCYNFKDFRTLAKKKLPSPIFHYIDGAADDEITYGRKRKVLNGDRTIDIDILDYNSLVNVNFPILPHPRMDKRNFVLLGL